MNDTRWSRKKSIYRNPAGDQREIYPTFDVTLISNAFLHFKTRFFRTSMCVRRFRDKAKAMQGLPVPAHVARCIWTSTCLGYLPYLFAWFLNSRLAPPQQEQNCQEGSRRGGTQSVNNPAGHTLPLQSTMSPETPSVAESARFDRIPQTTRAYLNKSGVSTTPEHRSLNTTAACQKHLSSLEGGLDHRELPMRIELQPGLSFHPACRRTRHGRSPFHYLHGGDTV